MEVMEELGGSGGFVKFLPFSVIHPRPPPPQVTSKVGIYVYLVAHYFFMKLEWNGISLRHYVCSLSRWWVRREIFWSCSHNASLVKFVSEILMVLILMMAFPYC